MLIDGVESLHIWKHIEEERHWVVNYWFDCSATLYHRGHRDRPSSLLWSVGKWDTHKHMHAHAHTRTYCEVLMNKKSIYIAVIHYNCPPHSLLCLVRDHKLKIQVIPCMQQAPEAIQSLPCWLGGTNIGGANTVSEMVRKDSSMVGLAHSQFKLRLHFDLIRLLLLTQEKKSGTTMPAFSLLALDLFLNHNPVS